MAVRFRWCTPFPQHRYSGTGQLHHFFESYENIVLYPSAIIFNLIIEQSDIYHQKMTLSRADPGFQVRRRVHLKKLLQAERREKSRFYAKKSYFFQFQGAPPLLSIPSSRFKKSIFDLYIYLHNISHRVSLGNPIYKPLSIEKWS